MHTAEQNTLKRQMIADFIASASPDVVLHDPTVRDPDFTSNAPQLPGNVTYDKKTIRFTLPKGKSLGISVTMHGVKAHSVFLSMADDPRFIQLYKGESGNGHATIVNSTHFLNPLGYDQVYLLTTASKDTPGREAAQPWWNNHPLGRPRIDVSERKTVWETDDSRNPGIFPNVTVTWYHDGFDPKFEEIG